MKGSKRLKLCLGILTLAGCAQFRGPEMSPLPEYQSSRFRSPFFAGPGDSSDVPDYSHLNPPRLEWPVAAIDVSQKFKPDHNRYHQGVDLRGRRGTPIYAAHAGRVVYAGTGFSGYGKMVLIEYDDQWATLYAHLNSFAVKTGERIRQGRKIGSMGRSGRATGVHLHFEVLYNKQPIDPLATLPAMMRNVASDEK